jgi:hypothetical protein
MILIIIDIIDILLIDAIFDYAILLPLRHIIDTLRHYIIDYYYCHYAIIDIIIDIITPLMPLRHLLRH